MYIFFEIIKGLFFFLTVLVGLFFLRGDIIVGKEYFETVKLVMMPGYLVFCGLILGYIIANIWMGNDEENPEQKKIYVRSFIIGILLGIFLAIIYIFV